MSKKVYKNIGTQDIHVRDVDTGEAHIIAAGEVSVPLALDPEREDWLVRQYGFLKVTRAPQDEVSPAASAAVDGVIAEVSDKKGK